MEGLPTYKEFLDTLGEDPRLTSSAVTPKLLSTELFRFLRLSAGLPTSASSLSPSAIVDGAWHHLLLFPQLYYDTCLAVRAANEMGRASGRLVLIPHHPRRALDSLAEKRGRYISTLAQYRSKFGAPLEAVWPPSLYAPGAAAASAVDSSAKIGSETAAAAAGGSAAASAAAASAAAPSAAAAASASSSAKLGEKRAREEEAKPVVTSAAADRSV